ncbi:hypothetical protein TGPRC2_427310, partial [Toxoplasma gondii TgCatPRC2]
AWGVVDGGPGEKCFAVCDWQVVFRRGCSLTGGQSDSRRSDVALARIVDVLGVAAPHGPAVVCLTGRWLGVLPRGGRCSPRSDIIRARSVDVLRLVAPQLSGGCNSLGYRC